MYDSDESLDSNDNSEMWSSQISTSSMPSTHDMYVLDDDDDTSVSSVESDDDINKYMNLDEHLDEKYFNGKDMMSIAKLVRGQPQKKRRKTEDLRPVVFVRLTHDEVNPNPLQW